MLKPSGSTRGFYRPGARLHRTVGVAKGEAQGFYVQIPKMLPPIWVQSGGKPNGPAPTLRSK